MKHRIPSLVYAAFLSAVGSILYRVRGGLAPALPRPFDQMLFALAYGAIVFRVSKNNPYLFIGVMLVTALALSTGHGQYMDLALVDGVSGEERVDFILKWFFGPDDFQSYRRDFCGLMVTGLIVTIPTGVVLALYKEYKAATVIGCSGVLKAVAYALSFEMGYATEGGEYLTGFLLWSAVILGWFLLREAEK